MHNRRILDDIARGMPVDSIIDHIGSPLDNLRISLIDNDGNVIFDNNDSTPFPSGDHNSRPEVIEGPQVGNRTFGVTLFGQRQLQLLLLGDAGRRRHRHTLGRSYTHSLQEVLKADSSILWIMIAFAIVLSLASYVASHKISLSIRRLNLFAEKAEKVSAYTMTKHFLTTSLAALQSHIDATIYPA